MYPAELKYPPITLETWRRCAVPCYHSFGIPIEFALIVSINIAFVVLIEGMGQPGANPEAMAVYG
jgi:hypothetical protein